MKRSPAELENESAAKKTAVESEAGPVAAAAPSPAAAVMQAVLSGTASKKNSASVDKQDAAPPEGSTVQGETKAAAPQAANEDVKTEAKTSTPPASAPTDTKADLVNATSSGSVKAETEPAEKDSKQAAFRLPKMMAPTLRNPAAAATPPPPSTPPATNSILAGNAVMPPTTTLGPGQTMVGNIKLTSPLPGSLQAQQKGVMGMPPPGMQGMMGQPMMLPGGEQGKPLGVEDALAYLDRVKRQFMDKPEVYNQFLEIMKKFKSHEIDTPGVINHVCELFKGHDNLILGFNTFLPPGYKIELPGRGLPPGMAKITGPMGFTQPAMVPRGKVNRARGNRAGGKGPGRGSTPGGGMGVNEGGPGGMQPTMAPNVEDNASTAASQGQPVEFDHAINYVTKIKKRFSGENDPTYKSFLDILHSYQNEVRSITEVLEEVSNLFKDHPDLLKEFTHFLPDAVRESAAVELDKRAARARKASQRAANKDRRRRDKKSTLVSEPDHDETRVPMLERNLFGRIKAALGTRELWGEFLKCLDLFAQELISRAELLSLISDIFGERGDLLEEFDRLLASRGATDDPVESAWFSMPLTDIDFSNCRRCTPSYRALPAAYPKAPCSERTAMCRSVLNDTWVSVPLGSEDSSSKNHRRNQYEEALFKCEDDRYEIDMVIDSNKAAIRALEPLAQEVEALSLKNGSNFKFRYRLEKRTLSVIHLKAIARIYGDHGTEILELLRRNPAAAIPVILKRLKEKDDEWCRDRQELNKGWKDQMEKNYAKSLDHRSFYFKHHEKRAYTQKVLVAEIKEKAKAAQANSPPNGEPATASESPTSSVPAKGGDSDHMVLDFEDPRVNHDAWGIIALKVERNCDAGETEKIAAFYCYFVHAMMQLPNKWLKPGKSLVDSMDVDESIETAPKTKADALPVGTKVSTAYGYGVVEDYNCDTFFYKVKIAFGTAYLSPSSVKLHSDDPLKIFTKPIAMLDKEAMEAATKEMAQHDFFTTVPVYMFFRQYHLLYERLLRAKEQCEANARKSKKSENAMETDGEETTPGEVEYTQLLSLIYCFINGSLEPSKFEDECRTLLGPQAFYLSTIERLVTAIQKQLLVIISDDKSMATIKLLGEYCEGAERRALTLAKVCQASASHLLQSDSMCLRMRFMRGMPKGSTPPEEKKDKAGANELIVPEDSIVKPTKTTARLWDKPPRLGISVLDMDPTQDGEVAGLDTDSKKEGEVATICPIEVGYSNQLELSGVLEFGAESFERPFLNRTVGDKASRSKSEQGLKLHLSLPLYKVVYVPGSEDVFQAIKQHKADKGGAERKSRFKSWYDSVVEGSGDDDAGDNDVAMSTD
uniref:Histone deacetylase interacting domain-containing protein n=1 Tax=Mucochytrium quahogii TaxID=96639 RepID=A0A7S2SFF8_9STRA|mmetsp:Transcript_5089/g.11148  ORF Transcript_5089/g.11148 Transcript_5089/m.11148 type:complete len:1335 (+) Transcript_5089:358-4362(+)